MPGERTAVAWAMRTPRLEPSRHLAGLSIARRLALTLDAAGATKIVLVVGEADAVLGAEIARDPRLGAMKLLVAPNQKTAFASLAEICTEPFVLAPMSVGAPPALYRALFEATPPAKALALRADASGEAGPLLARPELARLLAEQEGEDIDAALEAFGPRFDRRVFQEHGCARIDRDAGRRAAVKALFDACRKPVDGLVARSLNRPVSIAISKRIVELPLTPNHVSMATFAIGLIGAASAAMGGYLPMLAGALLMQANSVLDGVDGELARVRFQQSKLGQWLDTASDDLSTALLYLGVAIGARGGPFAPASSWAAAIAIGAHTLAVAQNYAELIRIGSGDFYALGWNDEEKVGLLGKVFAALRVLLKKDFFLALYVVFALAGALPLCLFVGAVGHVAALFAATSRTTARLSRMRSSTR